MNASIDKFLLFAFSMVFLSSSLKAQIGMVDRNAKVKPVLMVLGTYHMGTAGNNVFNAEVDDVTSPQRQKQMIELIEKLKDFKPTKVVLECDVEDDEKTLENYRKYLSGDYQLTKNETNQVGFRLAKELGHQRVYCVDWGIFPKDSLYNYQTYAANDPELDSFLTVIYRDLKQSFDEETRKLSTLSVIDQLILMNQPDRTEKSHQAYYEIMRIGRGDEYAGANYLSWWYGRNMKILTNIIRITDSQH